MSKANVSTEFRDGRSSDRELGRFALEVRSFCNTYESRTLPLETANTAADTAIYTSDAMGFDETALLQAKVFGTSADGTHYAAYELAALFRRVGSTAAGQLGATQAKMTAIESDAGLDCTLGVDASSQLYVKVNDGGVGTMNWVAFVEVRRG